MENTNKRRSEFQEPARSIVYRLGGPEVVADWLSRNVERRRPVSHVTVYRWMWGSERGGRGGVIPRWHHRHLIRMGAEIGVTLTFKDFFVLPEEPPPAPRRRYRPASRGVRVNSLGA